MAFDPRIILGHQQYTGPDANETMRTLSQLQLQGAQREHAQATLASLLDQQQQTQSLRDIYRNNAGNMNAVPQALMQDGHGEEALGFGTKQSENLSRSASASKAMQQTMQEQAELLARPLHGVKDQAGVDAAFRAWKQAGVSDQDLAQMPREYNDQTAPIFKSIADMGMPAEKRLQLEETGRHNRKMEDRPSGMPGQIIISGEGGAQFFADPRNPGAPARPVVGPDGKQIAKPSATKPSRALTKGDRDALSTSFDEQANLDSLLGRFKDGYAGKGAAGASIVGINKKLGSWASEGSQEEANFWADFQGSFDIARRNKMFGASLTPNENAAWEAAKTISPNSKPAVVRKALTRLRDLSEASRKRRGQSLAKDGYSSDAIEVYTGPLGEGPTKISSDADFDKLPSGAEFVGPDGKHRRKP